MSDKDVIQMIIDKLDRQDDKLDKITDKLNDFEVQATTILTSHEIEIKRHEKEIDDIKKNLLENDIKSNSNIEKFNKIITSSSFTFIFRFLVFIFMVLILSVEKLKVVGGLLISNMFNK